jgi:hypothetical protein
VCWIVTHRLSVNESIPGGSTELAVACALHPAEWGHGLISDALIVDVDDS